MAQHVIVGAGAVGSATAMLLAGRGEQVRLVSRHGAGPGHDRIERIAADAADAARLTEITTGAAALYNCASPLYHRWLADWPPLAASLLAAAERTGAVYAAMSNLYGYVPGDAPIRPDQPAGQTHPKLALRAGMWAGVLAAHQAGRIRAVEVRASDYLEANSVLFTVIGKPVLAGRRAYPPAALDVPHSWTSVHDCAQALVTVAGEDKAHGKVWFAPTGPALTVRQLAARFAAVNGAPAPRLTPIPGPVLWTAGLTSPVIRELRVTRYQFTRPFVIDSSATTEAFGLQPVPLDDALRDAAARLRE